MGSSVLVDLSEKVRRLEMEVDVLKTDTKDMGSQLSAVNESLSRINTTIKNVGWLIGTAAVIAPTIVMIVKG